MILLYNILLYIGIILGFPLIFPVLLISSKRRKTFRYRLGITMLPDSIQKLSMSNPSNRPLWVHALSVGEVLSAIPLVQGLKKVVKNRKIVFSASTLTGFEIANNLLNQHVHAIFFFPYDLRFSVKHIVRKINPALVLIVETDIWPNFLFEMKRWQVPVILANARLSKKSFSGYRRFSFFMKPVFLTFAKVCAQSKKDTDRFLRLGLPADRVSLTGNVKFDQIFEPLTEGEKNHLRKQLHIQLNQKVFLAGSTHKGEELILSDAFLQMKEAISDLLFVVVPRDPKRAQSVCRDFRSGGLETVLMSALNGTPPERQMDVIVVDTIGILRRLYALADIAFIGGSLVNCGGHNPLEPAAFSKPILFGSDMSDFREISHMLVKSGGAVQIHCANSLYNAATMILEDNQKAKTMGMRAFRLFCANRGAVDKTLKVIEAYIQ